MVIGSLDKKLQEALVKKGAEVVGIGQLQQQQLFMLTKEIGVVQQAAIEVRFCHLR